MIPRFDVATLFVEMCKCVTDESIIGRAQKSGKIEVHYHNIRDYANNKHNRVDDTVYGGGMGMLMQAEPVYLCYEAICKESGGKPYVVFPSPQGHVFNEEKAKELASKGHIMFLCGHYEGVDQRVLDEIVDEEISLGDFVLTGGELPALCMLDSIARLQPGVLSDDSCFIEESHWNGLLEYPQYTHPNRWHDKDVPPILLTGNHANITRWRKDQSILNTLYKRPDMLERAPLDKKDIQFLQMIIDINVPRIEEDERRKKAERKRPSEAESDPHLHSGGEK